MIALLVVLTFLTALAIDHLLHREPIPVHIEAPSRMPVRSRILPSVVAGFAVPDNLSFHPGHTWAASETPDRVRIGVDDLAARVAGPLTEIHVPTRGQWVRQGQKIISMQRDGRELSLVSPIEGTVADINQKAIDNPKLTQDDPYGDGWLLVVNAPDASTSFRNLLSGTMARRWMEDSAAKLRAYAFPSMATAQEGGVAVSNAAEHLSPAQWNQMSRELFLC